MSGVAFVGAFWITLVLAVISGSARGQGLVEVERHVWTDSIDRSAREFKRPYSSPIPAGQIYLWMQLKGSRELLDQLRQKPDGRIQIRHLWQRYDSDQIVTEFDIPLDVGRREDLRKLTYEVDALGFFRWRVWSQKEYLTRGRWRVDIVYDESYDPVMCASAGTPKPCSFAIEVR